MKPLPLDYEIIQDAHEWQIWTPDRTGGVIGSVDTKAEAISSATLNMLATIIDLQTQSQPKSK